MNETVPPLQITVEVEEIDTDGVTGELTVIVMILLFAIAGVAQVKVLVIAHITVLPLLKAAVEYVELLEPTGEPLTYH